MLGSMSVNSFSERARDIVVFGGGRGGETARRWFELDSPYRVVAHVVDREYLVTAKQSDLPTVAVDEVVQHFPPQQVRAFVAVGAARMNVVRAEKYRLMKMLGYDFVNYVHSSNHILGDCAIGENCMILQNQTVNFDVTIGDNVIIWGGCHIGDRSKIGDHAHLGAHVVVNGDVFVGEGAYIGSNSTLSHSVKVGAYSFIGANALISEDTAERSVHVLQGTPAENIDSMRFMRLLRTAV